MQVACHYRINKSEVHSIRFGEFIFFIAFHTGVSRSRKVNGMHEISPENVTRIWLREKCYGHIKCGGCLHISIPCTRK